MSEPLEKMINAARRVRFDELVTAYGGPAKFASELESRLVAFPELATEDSGLSSFMNATYISNVRNGRKNIGEATALQLELLFEKPKGWMSGDAYENFLVRFRRRRKTA